MSEPLLFEVAKWVFRVFLVVLPICTIAIWLMLPAHNGSFTRSFRRLFAAFSLVLIHASFLRFGGYLYFGIDPSVSIIASMIAWGLCIATAPGAMIAAYSARSSYRSEIARLAAATRESAKETEHLATQAREASADEDVTRGDM